MKTFHILNLGAGVQSTALYLMATRKEFGIPWFDAAIFADTGEEPEAVYEHLYWLGSLNGPRIYVANTGLKQAVTVEALRKHRLATLIGDGPVLDIARLGDDLKAGGSRRSPGSRGFVSIPAYTKLKTTSYDYDENDEQVEGSGVTTERIGLTRRQCTKEYKTEVIERTVRRDIFGLAPRERIAGRFFCHTYLGLSAEETRRVKNNLAIFQKFKAWREVHFPLWHMNWHRQIIKDYLAKIVPHETPRSACTFCPFHDNAEWQRLKQSPVDWERACHIDDMLRQGARAAQDMKGELYVHRSAVPLREADLSTDQSETHQLSFSGVAATDCSGFCGH